MSIFFELPMNLRERWSANTLEEREAVEEEFRIDLKALYLEALEVIRIPAWPTSRQNSPVHFRNVLQSRFGLT